MSEHGVLQDVSAEAAAEVRPIELFFDLVYVLAVTQVTHHLLEHLTPRGAIETLLLLLAVWIAWINTVWSTSYLDRGTRTVQLMLIGLMLAGLVMSAMLPEAFAGHGLAFAAALVTIQVGGTGFMLLSVGRHHRLSAVFERVLAWWAATGVLWIAGGLANAELRFGLWLAAVLSSYSAMWFGFPVPWLGRSHTADYTISGPHMAERWRLFLILALGESILVTGANFGELPSSFATATAFVLAFIGAVTMWWIYFDRAESAARRIIASASDPGRLALTAYTYCHIPMVVGIIVASAADEMTIAHPGDPASAAATALILGGPALYLAGNSLFKWTVWGHVPRSRVIALAALGLLIPLSAAAPMLLLTAATTLVLIALVVSDWRDERSSRRRHLSMTRGVSTRQ